MSRHLAPTLLLTAFAAACAFTLAACTTETEDEKGGNAYAALVGDWKISTATVSPVVQLPAVPGIPSLPGTTGNLLLILDDCDKNATTTFRANGVYINTEAAGCDHADTGSWVRNDSLLYVTYEDASKAPDTLVIVESSASVLKLRERNDRLPDRVMRTINWTLIPR